MSDLFVVSRSLDVLICLCQHAISGDESLDGRFLD